jgi:hypothetical protein
MAVEALRRIRSARAATLAAKTSRVRLATIAPGERIDTPPTLDAVGVADLSTRRVKLEAQPTELAVRLLKEVAVKIGRERELEQTRLETVELFLGDQHYTRGLEGRHWACRAADWYWRPLWALDALDAAAGDWVEGEGSDAHGRPAKSYSGEIDASLLRSVDPHWEKVLGRRGQKHLWLHVWLDDHGRAVRIVWKFPPAGRQKTSELQWYLSEFWDFGVAVDIDTPPQETISEPATVREIIRGVRAMWKAAK